MTDALKCQQCNGRGFINDPYDFYDVDVPDTCPACKGTGESPPPKYARKSSLTIEVCRADGCAPVVKLTVSTPRKTKDDYVTDDCFYAFRRIPCDIGGIGVQFDRLDFDRPERYHVRYVSSVVAECDCMAGSKGAWCKHCSCAEYLIENGELG